MLFLFPRYRFAWRIRGLVMKKSDVVSAILKERYLIAPKKNQAQAFAPTNIALIKYWGKRNTILNLPVTGSLSLSAKEKGALITLKIADQDSIVLNEQPVSPAEGFAKRLWEFINLFRKPNTSFLAIDIVSTVPIAAGLASSACGFASCVKALDELFAWNLSLKELSILARLGSGSACRSLSQGFV